MFPTDRCTKEYKKLYETYNEAEQILRDIGITDITVRQIRFNNRLQRTLAWYISESQIIEISTRHFACCNHADILCTILHEISHNVCENRHGKQEDNGGHTKEWQEIANYIEGKTGYDLSAVSDVEEDESKIITTPVYFHEFKCQTCGYDYVTYSEKENPNQVRKQKCMICLYRFKHEGKAYNASIVCTKSGIDHYKHQYKIT